MHAGSWALANVSTYPDLGGTNWVAFTQAKQAEFREQLRLALKQDDEINPLRQFSDSYTIDFPMGGQFLQSHDISSLIGGLD